MPSHARSIAAFGVLALGTSVGFGLLAPTNGDGSEATRLGVESLALELWLGSLALAVAIALPGRPGERLGLDRGRLSCVEVAVLTLGTLALSHALDAILALTGWYESSALPSLTEPLAGARGSALAVALLGLGIAPGLCEELLCRGLVQRAAVARLGARGGVVVAALVFGALHVEPIHVGMAAVLGLYLGWVAHTARSIRPAVVCHLANNVAAVLGAAYPGVVPKVPWASALVGLILAGVCLAWTARRLPPGESQPVPLQPDAESVER